MKSVLLFPTFCVVVLVLSVTPAAISQQSWRTGFDGIDPQAAGPGKGGGAGFGVDHAFKGPDGAIPTAALIQDAAGNLYGTTSAGGNSNCAGGCGVVFKLSPGKRETVLHQFSGAPSDGAGPDGRLVMDDSGNLYGTTSAGGASNLGTVFKLDVSGTETLLHSFSGGSDGANPYAGLIMVAGDLYGTTESGGTGTICPNGCGTVFKIDASGNETVLYSFAGGTSDGADPKAGLTLDSNGNLYGTTYLGGTEGDGTVFELSTNGTETILWNFTGRADGANPFGGVIRDANGVLYGTAENGGSHSLYAMGGPLPDTHYGCCQGTAYSLSGSNLTVLYTFTGNKDGGSPACDLVLNNGLLYGTTLNGGPGKKGTTFSLTIATKSETVLHGFRGAGDGGTPQAGLLMNGAGVLYGTATGGGRNQKGTVFQYKTQ